LLWLQITPKKLKTNEQQQQEEKWFLEPPFAVKKKVARMSHQVQIVQNKPKTPQFFLDRLYVSEKMGLWPIKKSINIFVTR
jgi:hypothetical protein